MRSSVPPFSFEANDFYFFIMARRLRILTNNITKLITICDTLTLKVSDESVCTLLLYIKQLMKKFFGADTIRDCCKVRWTSGHLP